MNLDKRLTEAAKKVARLEGELAEVQTKYDRLLFTHDEVTLPMLYEADERLKVLEAAIAAKDAALRSLLEDGRLSATTHDGIRAALSDYAGEKPNR